MRIGLITIFMMLVQFGNFKTSLRTSVIFCLTVVLMTGASYPVGEGIRYLRSGLGIEIAMESVAFKFGRRLGDSDKASSVLAPIAPMVNRLGVLDYAIEVLSERGNRRKLEQYMNFEYGIKNFINNMVLGSPFPEAEVMTSRIMSIVYRDFTMSRVKQHFLSEPWTAWGA